jgi:hypothetical protein
MSLLGAASAISAASHPVAATPIEYGL